MGLLEDASQSLIGLLNVSDMLLKAVHDTSDILSSIESAMLKSQLVWISMVILCSYEFSKDLIELLLLAEIDLLLVGEVIWDMMLLVAICLNIIKVSLSHSLQGAWDTVVELFKS